METGYLRRAFTSDFAINGPSIARMIRTMLAGWKRYKNHPDSRVRSRIRRDCEGLRYKYGSVLWATKKWYSGNAALGAGLQRTLKDIYAEFGLKARLTAPLLGRFLHYTISKEARRLEQGWTYEPMTVYERNEQARHLEKHALDLNWIEPQRRRLAAAFSTACEFVANLKRAYAVYPHSGYAHYRSKVSAWLLAQADIRGKGLLKIRLKPRLDSRHPLILELSGAFDRINAKQLKKRISAYLKEHEGTLVLNFNGLTAVEIKALEKFLKKLKGYRERIKLAGSDTLRAEIADALAGARKYFEVLSAEELLQGA
jgi:anti-anti-sigma regulatory factor